LVHSDETNLLHTHKEKEKAHFTHGPIDVRHVLKKIKTIYFHM